jgi:hypothetical protein
MAPPRLRVKPASRNIILRRCSPPWLMPSSPKRRHNLNSSSRRLTPPRHLLRDRESARRLRNRLYILQLPIPSSTLSNTHSSTRSNILSSSILSSIPSSIPSSILNTHNILNSSSIRSIINSRNSTKPWRRPPSLTPDKASQRCQ